MKNRYLIISAICVACLGLYLFYILMTTSILTHSLKTKGYISPNMSYRFASSSITGQSLVLYHLAHNQWPNTFIHRTQISLNKNGFDLALKNVHLDSAQLALKHYGAYLPDALDAYQVKNHFLKDWPLSIALFDLITPHTHIDVHVQQNSLSTYRIQILIKNNKSLILGASATVVINSSNEYEILQAQAYVYDTSTLKRIQGYAASRHQEIPKNDFTYLAQKNATKTNNPKSLK